MMEARYAEQRRGQGHRNPPGNQKQDTGLYENQIQPNTDQLQPNFQEIVHQIQQMQSQLSKIMLKDWTFPGVPSRGCSHCCSPRQ